MALTGAEILGVVAGVIQLADVGAKLSVKLSSFARKAKSADLAIRDVSQDVALTCNVLRELGNELRKDEEAKLCSNEAMTTAQDVIDECHKVFKDLDNALDKNKAVPQDAVVFKKWAQKLKYPFIEPHIDILRTNLERLKSTLLLMLSVIIYAGQLRGKASSSHELRDQRELIKTLNDEMKANKEKVAALSRQLEDSNTLSSAEHVEVETDKSITANMAFTSYATSPNTAGRSLDYTNTDRSAPMADDTDESDQSDEHDEIADYCALIRAVLSEVEAIKYAIDKDTRDRIRHGVLEIHRDQLNYYSGKFDRWRLTPMLNLRDDIRRKVFPTGALYHVQRIPMEYNEDKIEDSKPFYARLSRPKLQQSITSNLWRPFQIRSLKNSITSVLGRTKNAMYGDKADTSHESGFDERPARHANEPRRTRLSFIRPAERISPSETPDSIRPHRLVETRASEPRRTRLSFVGPAERLPRSQNFFGQRSSTEIQQHDTSSVSDESLEFITESISSESDIEKSETHGFREPDPVKTRIFESSAGRLATFLTPSKTPTPPKDAENDAPLVLRKYGNQGSWGAGSFGEMSRSNGMLGYQSASGAGVSSHPPKSLASEGRFHPPTPLWSKRKSSATSVQQAPAYTNQLKEERERERKQEVDELVSKWTTIPFHEILKATSVEDL